MVTTPRPHSVKVRMSDGELTALRDGAHAHGITVSEYMRLLLGDPSRAVVAHVEVRYVDRPDRAAAVRQAQSIGRGIWLWLRDSQDDLPPVTLAELRQMSAQLLAAARQ